jgi:putative membrane protein
LRFVLRWLVTAVAVAVTAWILPGITVPQGSSGVLSVLAFAAILGFVNAIIRPILAFLSCGCLIVTLGLFIFVINALCFLAAGWLVNLIPGLGIQISSFWTALVASIIVSVVSFLLNWLLPDDWVRSNSA